MKWLTVLSITLSLNCFGQCTTIPIVDSSFEIGIFGFDFPHITGQWYVSDGGGPSTISYTGDSSFCSNGGGCFQLVEVEPNTTYYLSCFVYDGINSPANFYVNWGAFSIVASTNSWTFASYSFNTGSDTTAYIGGYSNGSACFDDFRMTCNPLSLDVPILSEQTPFTISTLEGSFNISSSENLTVKVVNLMGQEIDYIPLVDASVSFGENYPTGFYIVNVELNGKLWQKKILKQ